MGPPADEQDREAFLFHRGIALFNTGHYFNAHEAWEDAWHQVTVERADFYQGLIQCAVALEHVRRGNPRGTLTVFARAKERLKGYPSPYMGLDWQSLIDQLNALFEPLQRLPKHRLSPRQHGQDLPIDLNNAPRLALQHDPFGSS
jgi:predicted metal-dependent hydrolase